MNALLEVSDLAVTFATGKCGAVAHFTGGNAMSRSGFRTATAGSRDSAANQALNRPGSRSPGLGIATLPPRHRGVNTSRCSGSDIRPPTIAKRSVGLIP